MRNFIRPAAAALLLVALTGSAFAASPPDYEFAFVSYPGVDATRLVGVRSDGVAVGGWVVFEPGPILFPKEVLARGSFEYAGGQFDDFSIPGVTDPALQGANDEGVLWGSTGSSARFVLGPGGTTLLDHPDYDRAFVSGVDAAGIVYGTRGNTDPNADPDAPIQVLLDAGPFVFDGQDYRDFVIPGLTTQSIGGARGDGIVWGTDSNGDAFWFDGSSVSVFDAPGDEDFNLIRGVSDEGLVLGIQWTGSSLEFLFDGDAYHPFSVPGASYWSPTGMNGDGVIWGSSSLGAFIATPVPEPAGITLVALVVLAVFPATRRRSR